MERCNDELAKVKDCAELEELINFTCFASDNKLPVHDVEAGIYKRLLKYGLMLLNKYINDIVDDEDAKTENIDSLETSDGRRMYRLRKLRSRQYHSIFGGLSIKRRCFGDGDIVFAPSDETLNLPKNSVSYLLQNWVAGFCTYDSFAEATKKLDEIMGTSIAVRTAERLSLEMSQDVESFRKTLTSPPEEEGELLVLSADGKGIPITQGRAKKAKSSSDTLSSGESSVSEKPPEESDSQSFTGGLLKPPSKGQKPGRKKMACVTKVYTVDRNRRDVSDIIREIIYKDKDIKRPVARNKEVRGDLVGGKEASFVHLAHRASQRGGNKPVVFLADGEKKLWALKNQYLPDAVGILDIYHVMQRLWSVGNILYGEDSDLSESRVKLWLRWLLEGHVGRLLKSWRQSLSQKRLRGDRQKTVNNAISYLENNRERMHYNYYLSEGYPIGSGAVEGACRHLVKDRMERTGMRWIKENAQAMLDLRAMRINNTWNAYLKHHIQKEHQRIYPDLSINKVYIKRVA